MTTDAEAVLEGLDPEQRQIAEHLRGPVSVLAGAGTGKTRAITHRIAYGVRSGVYAPERVLAVTFTRKAAGELQGRLRGLGADGVRAQTFHGAALAQLGHFWPDVIGGAAPQIIPGKVAALSQTVEAAGLRLGGEALRDLAAEIEWRKTSMLSIDRYSERIEERPIPTGLTAEQLIDLHGRYAGLLEERRQIDFEDVLVLLTGMLESEPRVALQVRERYRFFTVDEYQDVSPLQHALLRVWLGDRDDLCVVGDASQTIYSFAGASSSYLLRFGVEHPNARQVRLERNYRSVEPVVRLSNRLMRDRPGALTLSAIREDPAPAAPTFEWFASEYDEAQAVAGSIAAAIQSGTPASEIAVLYRTNAQSARFEEALRQRGIGVRVHGAQRFFDRADVRQAVMLIRGEAKVADDRPLFQIVSDALRAGGWTAKVPEGAAEREKWEALSALLSLVDEMPPGAGIREFSEELLARQRTQHEPTLDAVTLSAVHAAKGLEWTLVHVAGLSEGQFPIVHAVDEASIDEERRLAYVAFTRARDTLRLSGVGGVGRAARHPSRFVGEAGLV
ncbi:ATP-dependent DNA helicase UvrD/PcrA, actinomycete paralog [Leucobacter sp. 7(1)]|uniref:ATP-dependent helicase n=1 Tax=Leucobacter sp. 7(1) TaxID=1255613 RepID=UPI00097EB1CE|nr:ATP-dependent helicase [Leucobacter sp. 7(1)]SJN08580.1 ATP-dependent DNA helicase UvrD/PcrA, actinomycete paralog [Leucobacter sp. 7(1)]